MYIEILIKRQFFSLKIIVLCKIRVLAIGDNVSEYKIFTSESVSEGHPDKMADQISDAVLDAMLKDDPESRVACETLIKDNLVVLAGEITSRSEPDLEALIRKVILGIGYDGINVGCVGNTCEVINVIGKQSQDIAQGVNEGEGEDLEQGAGDLSLIHI